MSDHLLLSTNGAGMMHRGAIAEAEQQGWGIYTFGDSQVKAPDPFVRAAGAASSTSKILLRMSVTNPITRDASVNASAAAALQIETEGRAVLGIGAGYTSLGLIGLKYPTPFKQFEEYLGQVRSYLAGDIVERNGVNSRLRWLPNEFPTVPVDVTASGPRNIRLGAVMGDWLTLAVGAKHENVARAIELAKASAKDAGRDFDEVFLGIHVPIGVSKDRATACEGIRNTVASMAGFTVMATPTQNSLSEVSADLAESLRTRLGVVREDQVAKKQEIDKELTDDFVSEFALAGTPEQICERLAGLQSLGVKYVNVVFGSDYVESQLMAESYDLFVNEVLPNFSAKASHA